MSIVTKVASTPAKKEAPAQIPEFSDPLKKDKTAPNMARISGDPASSIKTCDQINHLRLLRRHSSASVEYMALAAESVNDVFIS
jgi:hypothetical protein